MVAEGGSLNFTGGPSGVTSASPRSELLQHFRQPSCSAGLGVHVPNLLPSWIGPFFAGGRGRVSVHLSPPTPPAFSSPPRRQISPTTHRTVDGITTRWNRRVDRYIDPTALPVSEVSIAATWSSISLWLSRVFPGLRITASSLKTIAPPLPSFGPVAPAFSPHHPASRARNLPILSQVCGDRLDTTAVAYRPSYRVTGTRTPRHLHTPRAPLPARNQRRYGPGTAAPTLPGRARDRQRFNICDVNQGYPSTSKRLRGVSCVELRPSTTLPSPIGQDRTQDRDRPFELWPRALEGLSHSGPCRSLRSRTTKASQNNFTLASNLHRRRRPTRSRRSLWIPPSRTARPLGGRNSCPTRPRPPPRTATPRRDRRAAPAPGTKWPIQFPLFFERRPTPPSLLFPCKRPLASCRRRFSSL